jgi:hypothetical protein
MKKKIITLFYIFSVSSCSYTLEPQYEEFVRQNQSKGKYDLSESTDVNLCRLKDMTNGEIISEQIRKKISQSVKNEIEARNLDCDKPFPQREEKYSATSDELDLYEWLKSLLEGI